ncbi:MAG: hypothetical protein U0234_18625 [Sandaracinus sp.]
MSRRERRRSALAPGALALVLLASASAPGCFDNVGTPFPPGLEPWESTNQALAPAPVDGDVCPETITFARVAPYGNAIAEHARACIHAPIDVVWASIRNPQTGRDPTSTQPPFMVLPEPIASECDGLYETQLHVDDIIDVDFRICWRHAVVEGTDDAPLVTATRWQKVWGTSVLRTLEGSLVAHPHPDDPGITELEYQYHLDGVMGSAERIESYLSVIYARLRDDAHGIPLLPADD